ncbi:hypothetical protein ABS71_08655 [bacterium SCN 62-11]|nr:type II secretion system protein [Candidatus Eremiobacteraeota bacterium]ODT70271.1 MAG: hypothetical protein ABS71_08655 [bacterium SCN 62-11]
MKRSRAFVLLSVMFVMLVVGMLLRAAIIRMPVVTGAYRHASDREEARRAAESGLEYALTRLRENPRWCGNSNGVVVDQAGIRVAEQNGNVIGNLTQEGGASSQFRLRFNYQDGPGGGEGMPNPPSDFWIKSPWVSVNNLLGTSNANIPQGDGADGRVQDPPTLLGLVPSQSVTLRCEGVCNSQTSVVESVYRVTANHAVSDAVVMAGGDLKLNTLGNVTLDASHPRNSADNWVRLRTKKSFAAMHPGGDAAQLRVAPERKAQIGHDPSRSMTGSYDADKLSIVPETSDDGNDFYSVKWENVHQADSNSNTNTAVHIPAGTYAAWDDGSVHYFDKTLSQYRRFISNPANRDNQGTVVSANLEELRTGTNVERNPGMSVKPHNLPYYQSDNLRYEPGVLWRTKNTDMLVEPSSTGKLDFSLVPKFPAPASSTEEDYVEPPDGSYSPDNLMLYMTNTTITAPGKVNLQCCVKGRSGTITSQGDMTIVAGRTLTLKGRSTKVQDLEDVPTELLANLAEKARRDGGKERAGLGLADDDSGTLQLNIYSKSDVTISSFTGHSYRSLGFQGLMYSWGDFRLNAGEANPDLHRGNVVLTGALVSYGNDPATQAPGRGTDTGGVSMIASRIRLTFDPRFLPAINQLQPDGTALFQLTRSAYRVLPH